MTRKPAPVAPRRNLLDILDSIIEIVALAGFIIMMIVTLLQVAVRYLEVPLDWTEELARTLFLAAIMLGIAIAIRRREHIVVDVVYVKLPPMAQAIMGFAFDAGILVLLIVWLRGAWRLLKLNADATFVMLPWIKVSYLYAVEAAAIVLMIVYVVADIARRGRQADAAARSP
jgi:TRAP-type C4-dicarboxylate transport system permease small subunit